jgi:hypothetical protein
MSAGAARVTSIREAAPRTSAPLPMRQAGGGLLSDLGVRLKTCTTRRTGLPTRMKETCA